ncbi:MAG: 16S rRNA (adenine(1518)-N(6)/adenine(1519)-N(6))-dimethyltransferase RsmA [Corynebacterium sp.]|nr:16S rRNA (adenine(1518)-N(6)/adenine(1519)-N(6))-dimethyltransferase RsmA [Corynebacterium sp.]
MQDTESPAQLLGPQQIRQLAAQLDVSPTKKLGQNFLHDPNTVRMIVNAAELNADDHVIEVGPGLGSLTLGLVSEVAKVTAVEIDPRLAAQLPITVAEFAGDYAQHLELIHRDALKITSGDIDAPTAIVANLPYNVAVPVLLHLLECFPTVRRVLVMVQLEVADRLAAAPGNKVYGIPSVKAGFYGEVRKAGTIGKKVFWPAPKIDSGLVRIDCFTDAETPWPRIEAVRKEVFQLVDLAFAQRRKTLRAALRAGMDVAEVDALLAACNIDPTTRGEKLATADFVALAATRVQLQQEGGE